MKNKIKLTIIAKVYKEKARTKRHPDAYINDEIIKFTQAHSQQLNNYINKEIDK